MSEAAVPPVSLSLRTLRRPIATAPQQLFVLARVASAAGPAAEAVEPVRLVVALDCSGSMQGAKMEAALATMRALVEELDASDRLALVTFANGPAVAVEPVAMAAHGRQLVQGVLAGTSLGGGTDLCGALLLALALAQPRDAEPPGHVIVLTDGEPTVGVTSDAQIASLSAGALGGATLSVFGYGTDVRSELCGQLADMGKGNYHFVPATEPPVEAFASELGRQRTLLGVDVALRLELGDGIGLGYAPHLAQVRARGEGFVELALPPLVPADARSLVLGLDVTREAIVGVSVRPWLRAVLSYRALSDAAVHTLEATLVPMLADRAGPVVADVARELVVQRVAELLRDVGKASLEALDHKLSELRALAKDAGLERDPLVTGALEMLAGVLLRAREASTRHAAHVEAAALSRGVYHRDVTSMPVAAYKKQSTMTFSGRLKKHMQDEPVPPVVPPRRGGSGDDES